MRDYERLRAHASRLLALAETARNGGHHELAHLAADAYSRLLALAEKARKEGCHELARLAADAYDQAFEIESKAKQLMTHPGAGDSLVA